MGKKSKKIRGGGLVFSTNPDTMGDLFSGILNTKEEPVKNASTKDDQVRVWLDRKGRNGKEVSLVKGISGNIAEIKKLASFLKTKCCV
jgi:translation initiation factor 1